MKTYNSSAEGVWKKISYTYPNTNNRPKPGQFSTESPIMNEEDVTSEELLKLNQLYDSIKPSLQNEDVYEFIAMDVLEENSGVISGILNYRINHEHNQIRF